MSEDLDENITSLFQRLLPFMSSVLLLLISYIPLDFSVFNNIRPSIGLICVYFWMLHVDAGDAFKGVTDVGVGELAYLVGTNITETTLKSAEEMLRL